jgi:hypothetical protein
MEDGVHQMALTSYGYGLWNYPYWFIGPEQGQASHEKDDLGMRIEAWCHFGKRELDDCRAFHERIGEKRWHGLDGKKPRLQSTWYRLILLLMGFLKRERESENLREYQRDRWGRQHDGETCVIELSGLAARNFKVPRDREIFRSQRIEVIRQRMADHKPSLVVLYGIEQSVRELIVGRSFSLEEIVIIPPTILTAIPHPARSGWTNERYVELGKRLGQM